MWHVKFKKENWCCFNLRLERAGECMISVGFTKTGISWSINKIDV